MKVPPEVPERYRKDLLRAMEILKAHGCNEIYLFGSLASGQAMEGTDIDLAVRGCPQRKFFAVYGELMLALENPVDLISLDWEEPFGQYLESHGELVQVA